MRAIACNPGAPVGLELTYAHELDACKKARRHRPDELFMARAAAQSPSGTQPLIFETSYRPITGIYHATSAIITSTCERFTRMSMST